MSDESKGEVHELAVTSGFKMGSSLAADGHIITYPQRLLTLAQESIDRGEYSISIVVSHIACEVATDRAFAQAFRAKKIEYLENAIEKLLPGNNLGNENVRRIYTAMTGDEIQNQPFWRRFKDSAARRNKVSHNSMIYEKSDAEASLVVAKEFVAHLNQ